MAAPPDGVASVVMPGTATPESHPSNQIDWVRASFVGAITGGVLWAIITRALSVLDPVLPILHRLIYTVGGTAFPVVILGLALYRTDTKRSYGVAMLLALCFGLIPVLLVSVLDIPDMIAGQ